MTKRMLLLGFLCALLISGVFGQAKEAETPPFQNEIIAFEQADKADFPPKNAILFTGSSSIRYWTNLQESFPGKKVINRGFGGSGLWDLNYYAGRIIFPYTPKQVVIYSGENDIANGKTAEEVFDAFKLLVENIRQKLPRTKIAYVSMKPSPSRMATLPEVKKANTLIESYLKKTRAGAYINIFDPMLDSTQQPRPELFLEDRLHMTPKGYELWTSIIKPYLK
jgi:lysophospholipase L1-like esterase